MAPDSPEIAIHIAVLQGLAAWLDGDTAGAVAVFDRSRGERGGPAPFSTAPLWGLSALLQTVLNPNKAEDVREDMRAAQISVQICNHGALHYADAITAGRAGDRAGADRLVAEGDRAMTGHPYWRHLLRLALVETAAVEGFGDPQGWLRAALADLDGTGEVRLLRRCRKLMRRPHYPG